MRIPNSVFLLIGLLIVVEVAWLVSDRKEPATRRQVVGFGSQANTTEGPATAVPTTKHVHAEVPAPYADLQNPLDASPENLAAGRRLFTSKCAICHGMQGDGNGPAAVGLSPKPAAFTDTHMMSEASDGFLFWRVSDGSPDTTMTAWKERLSQEQRWQVLCFIRSTFAPGTESHLAERTPGH